MLTLSLFAKITKQFALNSSISDETFLNALLEPLVTAARIRGRGGIEFHLDKSRTSQILNCKCDVPKELRKALARFEIENSVTREFTIFISESIDLSRFQLLSDSILTSISENYEIKEKLQNNLNNKNRFMAIALLEAIKNDNCQSTYKDYLWNNGTGSLNIVAGDIFSYGFGKPRRLKQIVVIPVDTTFETKVTWQYEEETKPLISPKSVHGQWIIRMNQAGISSDELDNRINKNLQMHMNKPLGIKKINYEERNDYPIGTIAVIENTKSIFYLLAIARFDENNNAQTTRKNIEVSICKLLTFYDKVGQSFDMYIPLIGTGNSRANLSHQESLNLIEDTITTNKKLIHGNVTIIVFVDDVKKLELSRKEHHDIQN